MNVMKIEPLRIGKLTIETPALLAPMAGFTTPVFRAICRRMGSGLAFTEMVPSEGVRRHLPQTMIFLEALPEERPAAAHIYGKDPDSMAAAAAIIESMGRFDLIDINCGCPVPKIMNKGCGVGLMRDPERVGTIVRKVREATSLPVTVKTRLGLSAKEFNIFEVAQAIEEGGASAIFLHGRLATHRHSGPVDFEAIKRVKRERCIPVIGNGGITSAGRATEMVERTGVDGVMIGQGAIGNPWVFREIRCAWTGIPYEPPSTQELIDIISEHLRGLYETYAGKNRCKKRPNPHIERLACQAFRAHLGRYLHGVRGIKALQRNLMQMETIDAVIGAVIEILEAQELQESETIK